ncbi:MAG: hypothetical protein KF886_09635 [Candidatus Hydrogenedentes bacterium]|nr:hypothetical protein [Candidatus Hydrogenedentota bacterium]
MKTDTKKFDCVEFMHDGALRIYEETKGMTLEEEMAYWRQKHMEALGELSESPERSPE